MTPFESILFDNDVLVSQLDSLSRFWSPFISLSSVDPVCQFDKLQVLRKLVNLNGWTVERIIRFVLVRGGDKYNVRLLPMGFRRNKAICATPLLVSYRLAMCESLKQKDKSTGLSDYFPSPIVLPIDGLQTRKTNSKKADKQTRQVLLSLVGNELRQVRGRVHVIW